VYVGRALSKEIAISMNVTEAVQRRISVRAFRPDPVSGTVVRDILEKATRAPSGGNLQPWKVYALAGQPLAEFKSLVANRTAEGATETAEYEIYPPNLWEPYRSYRFQCGEDLYSAISIPREDKAARFQQLARNLEFFGAPVGLFYFLERRMGPPQWADLGMYMQTVMLLAVEQGLDTCAQEFWALRPQTVREFVGAPADQMLFAGMCMGYRDREHAINTLRTRRAAFDDVASMRGFDP
jgi:nitroreductase